jgi:lipopolysaccharide/colanic/teichoic acid biosynthesis glycosyltransferase
MFLKPETADGGELSSRQARKVSVSSWHVNYATVKSIMDVTAAILALVFLAPIMALIALLVVLSSPGPAIFVQTRVGKDGRRFKMFKFRTLYHHRSNEHQAKLFMRAFVRGDTEPLNGENQAGYKPVGDASMTRFGKFLRKTSLDELPQLFNILRGDMSLIGPRPNVTWEVDEYKTWHMARLKVLPGVTGLAQVNGRSSIDFDTIVRYDIEYVENQSLWLDLRILWRTVSAVLRSDGAG